MKNSIKFRAVLDSKKEQASYKLIKGLKAALNTPLCEERLIQGRDAWYEFSFEGIFKEASPEVAYIRALDLCARLSYGFHITPTLESNQENRSLLAFSVVISDSFRLKGLKVVFVEFEAMA